MPRRSSVSGSATRSPVRPNSSWISGRAPGSPRWQWERSSGAASCGRSFSTASAATRSRTRFATTCRLRSSTRSSRSSLSAKPAVVVDVTGFQWSWEFQYPQYTVKNSAHGVTEVGPMWNGRLSAPDNGSNCLNPQTPQDCNLPLLEIPAHETVRFNLVSNDVVHSFWILPFDFKRDVLPDHPNHFDVFPTATLYSGPDTIGRCSELCGLYHSRMLFRIKIVTPAQFTAWITAQQKMQNASGGAQ